MAKSKKEFNREAMYKKIMPSINKIEEAVSEAVDNGEINPFEGQIVNVDSKIRIININSKVDTEDFDEYQEVGKGIVELADGSYIDNKLGKIADKVKKKENLESLDIKDISETKEDSEEVRVEGFVENSQEDNAEAKVEPDYKLYEFEKIVKTPDEKTNLEELVVKEDKEVSKEVDDLEKKNVNLVELALNEKLDHVLEKFDCCKCDECKNDIREIVLNTLPEIGFTGTQKEINDAFKEFKTYDRVNVSAAIIKAIVSIRTKRKH